ncbi:MAG TPA: glucoamylase family protein [Gemmatimonadales bacterium]
MTGRPPEVFAARELGAALARRHGAVRQGGPSRPLRNRLSHLEQYFHTVDERLTRAEAPRAPAGAEWLIDNAHVITEALRQVEQHLPPAFYRELPKLEDPRAVRQARVHAIAVEAMLESGGLLDAGRVEDFLSGYQDMTPLTMGELWAFPSMLRLALLEELAVASAAVSGIAPPGPVPTPESPAGAEQTLATCVKSLRWIAVQDWKLFFEAVSPVHRTLLQDPAGVYPRMDFETRNTYRRSVEQMARWAGVSEQHVTDAAIARCQRVPGEPRASHVGFPLIDAGRLDLERELGCLLPLEERIARTTRRFALPLYLAGLVGLTLGLAVLVAAFAGGLSAAGILVTLLPASGVAIAFVNRMATQLRLPRRLPRLDPASGVPPGDRSVVVVPTLLQTREDLEEVLGGMERNFHGNEVPGLNFVLLTDFRDAAAREEPGDTDLLARAAAGITDLNARLAGKRPVFHLVHRGRQWNPAERCWMGWERKRGKLVEFNRLVLGAGDTTLRVEVGSLEQLQQARFAITLDADTVLPHGTAARLIATLAHPLNRPELDPSGRVTAGYSVLQPRVATTPASATQSRFAEAFQGDNGLDLYDRVVSDVYQDLFDQGVFAGKGIYEIAAFERTVRGRVPPNALLSHDLFEGILGRTGYVSDVVLLEDLPAHPVGYFRRLHRWVRGDWQLLPWLGSRVPSEDGTPQATSIGALGRWMMLDNLRRSLLPPAFLLLLLLGWTLLPGAAWRWTLAGIGLLAMPVLFEVGSAGLTLATTRSWRRTVDGLMAGWRAAGRWLIDVVFLAHQTLVVADAIARTLWRLAVTRRHLLEWTTFAHTARALTSGAGTTRAMAGSAALALVAAGLVLLLRPPALPVAAPLLLAWLAAPGIAIALSRPRPERIERLDSRERRRLRALARRTWHFFERFLGPAERWLVPDNFQEAPGGIVARRTSPTNLGMSLGSVLAAYDLGFVGVLELSASLRSILEAMDRLERYRGHFLNWYDTRNDRPLEPRYVSTVDSGNLAGALLAVRQGCRQAEHDPVILPALRDGLHDTVVVLREILHAVPPEAAAGLEPIRESLHLLSVRLVETRHDVESYDRLFRWIREEWSPALSHRASSIVLAPEERWSQISREDLFLWIELLQEDLGVAERLVHRLAPWGALLTERPRFESGDPEVKRLWSGLIGDLARVPPLDEIEALAARVDQQCGRLESILAGGKGPANAGGVGSWFERLREVLGQATTYAADVRDDLNQIANAAEDLFRGMDFSFLFDDFRRLFRLGYSVTSDRYDPGHYDLLASEARFASLVAIAKGDVPATHWIKLQRPLARVHGDLVLLSWGGTMFEFLMPPLFTFTPPRTLLYQAVQGAIRRQVAFGAGHGTPWGVSESGFAGLDPGGNYRYRAFGVPGLGMRRDTGDRLVISPYASALALPFAPETALFNLDRIAAGGGLGRHGFYEALDYGTAPRADGSPILVRSYMAHHQGMALLAMDNALNEHAIARRVHADLRIASIEPLLQERSANQPTFELPAPATARVPLPAKAPPITRWSVDPADPIPTIHVLSNGRYHVLATGAGGGGSRWQGLGLTRWRADPGADAWGPWIYLQDQETGQVWSATAQPATAPIESYTTHFEAGAIEYHCRHEGLSVRTRVVVPVEDDVEIRIVTLSSTDGRARRLAVTSYGEVVLAPPDADRRHQAFAKLFVESSALPGLETLLFRRRPHAAGEDPVYLAHRLVRGPGCDGSVSWETDRARFLGRSGRPASPAALEPGAGALSGTTGDVMDPVYALRSEVSLARGGKVELAFITAAGRSRGAVLDRLAAYRSFSRLEWAAGRTSLEVEHRIREAGGIAAELPQQSALLSALITPYHALRAAPEVQAATRWSQPSLWRFGISGDFPIVLAFVAGEQLSLVSELLRAHAHWRMHGTRVDLVLVDEVASGYEQPVREAIDKALEATGSSSWLGRHGGVFVLDGPAITDERHILASAARVVLDANRVLATHLERLRDRSPALPRFEPFPGPGPDDEPTPPLAPATGLLFDNGLGGFTPDGREYIIRLAPGVRPPAPWSNVCANAEFGCVVTDTGLDMTWAANSSENRLTPWRNDPVNPPPAEVLYLRDEESGDVWSATPEPAGQGVAFEVRHGHGYSEFRHARRGLHHRLRVLVHPDHPVKLIELTLSNTWRRPRRITLTHYAEWVFGSARDVTAPFLVTEYDDGLGALLARSPIGVGATGSFAAVGASERPHGFTCDRQEFLGNRERWLQPAGLVRIGLSGFTGTGRDPCAALQLHLDIPPGESRTVHFVLCYAGSRAEALELVRRWSNANAVTEAMDSLAAVWDAVCGCLTIETPDPALDTLVRWLPYQVLSARVWGRTGLYQSSGGYGFRDQLQDVMALVLARPDVARDHLLRAASQQFREGDVLHWWHPGNGAGVRTRCSDDMAWLPFVVAYYVETTGDDAVLGLEAPFLDAPQLERGELQRYNTWRLSSETGTLYEHCRRALDRAFTAGPHGLPLIGTGDWNDGFDRVGREGRGESIWLGWFLCAVAADFGRIARRWGRPDDGERWAERAERVRQAIEQHGWDGAWYRRAYHDDGSVLGSRQAEACQIDSVAQTWSVLSGVAEPARAELAMQSVLERLVKWDDRLVLLLTPPFDAPRSDPGYVSSYPPGVRENGAQYTHAAAWVVWAFTALNQPDVVARLLAALNPINHTGTPEGIARYRGEPYVVAGDVGAEPPHVGRAGWTWYTGSAAWIYRSVVEGLLGIRRLGDSLVLDPCLPAGWPEVRVTYRYGSSRYHIRIENRNGGGRGVRSVVLDGAVLTEARLPLVDDGAEHQVEVESRGGVLEEAGGSSPLRGNEG